MTPGERASISIGGDICLAGGSECINQAQAQDLAVAQLIASIVLDLALIAVRWLSATLGTIDVVVPAPIGGVVRRR
ncbi:hypothetical protein [Arthrobacter sp. TWP1-1]|uniref:hypothetical protein n=1 Tax=Arthrobacter sp. TWP1-1 TaxID=2804568 RepID=UPI003CE8B9B3